MNENYTIDAFAEPITALSTQPSLPPDELKRRLQAPAEEVRQAHNALAQSHKRLDNRVSGIVAQTFGDTIPKSMLSHELQSELDAKAKQETLLAEIEMRERLAKSVTQKCEAFFGVYTGDGQAEQLIQLNFTPKAVLVFQEFGITGTGSSYQGGLAFPEHPAKITSGGVILPIITIEEQGFCVYNKTYGSISVNTNMSNYPHYFIAFH